MNMTSKVDYEALVDMDQKQILATMREGKIAVPAKGTDERTRFEEFCAMDPGSDQRKAYLSDTPPAGPGGEGTPPDATAGDATGGEGTPPPAPAGEGDSAGSPPPASDGGTPVDDTPPPADEWAGYGSREKLLEAHGNLKDSVESLTKQVRSLRSTDGKLGQKAKDLESKLAEKETELADMRKKLETPPAPPAAPAGAEGTPPPAPVDRPKRPDPKDYEDGEADSKYMDDREAYEVASEQYMASLEGRLDSITGKFSDLENRFNDVASKADQASSFAATSQETAAEQATAAAWDGMWDETRQIQDQMGLKTTTDIRTLNDHWLSAKHGTAEEKAASNKFLASVPPQDIERFKKVAPVINAMFTFEDAGPQKRYPNVQAALWATTDAAGNPLAQQYANINVPTPGMSPSQAAAAANNLNQNGNGAASAIPASDLGANDKPLASTATQEEKKARLRDLQAIRKKNIRAFDTNVEYVREYRTLIADLGGSTTLAPVS